MMRVLVSWALVPVLLVVTDLDAANVPDKADVPASASPPVTVTEKTEDGSKPVAVTVAVEYSV